MKIITISREFGSGGRELGKRLAEELGFAYYDREIVSEIANRCALDESYVNAMLEKSMTQNFSIHYGRTFSYYSGVAGDSVQLFSEQTKILKEIAEKENCVIVGRASDVILSDYNPFNVFVYASTESKVKRCMARAEKGNELNEKETLKMIKKIDSERKKVHGMISEGTWGDKDCYHLCVNTTGLEIKKIIPTVANYARVWFEENKQ